MMTSKMWGISGGTCDDGCYIDPMCKPFYSINVMDTGAIESMSPPRSSTRGCHQIIEAHETKGATPKRGEGDNPAGASYNASIPSEIFLRNRHYTKCVK